MDPFWNNAYDDVKDRRYGNLFISILLIAVLGLPLLVVLLDPVSDVLGSLAMFVTGYPDVSTYQIVCLSLLAILILVETFLRGRHWVRIGRKRRADRLKYATLSRDELFKARSKLKNGMKPVKFRAVDRPAKRPPPRARDTDLRY